MTTPPDDDHALAARIRDAVNAAALGHGNRYIDLDDVRVRFKIADKAAMQRAAILAARLGWIKVLGREAVHSVAITPEGHRLSTASDR